MNLSEIIWGFIYVLVEWPSLKLVRSVLWCAPKTHLWLQNKHWTSEPVLVVEWCWCIWFEEWSPVCITAVGGRQSQQVLLCWPKTISDLQTDVHYILSMNTCSARFLPDTYFRLKGFNQSCYSHHSLPGRVKVKEVCPSQSILQAL